MNRVAANQKMSLSTNQPREQSQVSCITGGFFTSWASREVQGYTKISHLCIRRQNKQKTTIKAAIKSLAIQSINSATTLGLFHEMIEKYNFRSVP